MKTDTYTKAVLTVIALCLLWLCALSSGLPLEAQQRGAAAKTPQRPQPVVVVGWGSIDNDGQVTLAMTADRSRTEVSLPVRVQQMPPQPIDVRLEYADTRPLPVAVTRIAPAGEWEPVRTRVEPEGARGRPGGGQ